jgi:hypothetical protein
LSGSRFERRRRNENDFDASWIVWTTITREIFAPLGMDPTFTGAPAGRL